MRFLLLFLLATSVYAQQPWTFAPDTSQVTMIGSHQAQPGDISQAYSYVMMYDSLCMVQYMVTECRLNRDLLMLLHWQEGRVVHAPDGLLAFNSRTAMFPLHPGDTVSFYRELRWLNPVTRYQGLDNYYALDTLEWIAHLVRADGTPIALVDSTGILPRTSPSSPQIYGSRPIFAVATYVIPSSVTGDSAFIGFTVHARGSGPYFFVRSDIETARVSDRLQQAQYIDYLKLYSPPGLEKRVIGEELQDDRFALTVRPTGRDIAIDATGPDAPGTLAINVYDATGGLVYSPYSAIGSQAHVLYRAENAGAYIIALLCNHTVVRTTKITIR